MADEHFRVAKRGPIIGSQLDLPQCHSFSIALAAWAAAGEAI